MAAERDIEEIVALWRRSGPLDDVPRLLILHRRRADLDERTLDDVEHAFNELLRTKGGASVETTREREDREGARFAALARYESEAERLTVAEDARRRAQFLREADDYEGALIFCLAAERIAPMNEMVLNTLSSCLRRLERPFEALAFARRSIALVDSASHNSPGFSTAAAAALECGEVEEAAKYAHMIDQIAPTSAWTLWLLAKIFNRAGQVERALLLLDRAAAKGLIDLAREDSRDALTMMIRTHEIEGRLDEAAALRSFLTRHGGLSPMISTRDLL